MYESTYDVIDTLIRLASEHMDSSATCPEGWLEETLENEGMSAWGSFKEDRSLDEFESFDELRDAFDVAKDCWQEEQWESSEVEQAVENEVDAVWCSLTDYMDTDDKFAAIRNLV